MKIMTSPLRIIVTGLIAQHPQMGGVTWDYLQYLLGLDLLGHDVYYFEDSGQWPYTLDGGPSGNEWIAHDPSLNVNYLAAVMARFGLADKWAYRFPIKPAWFGLSDPERKHVIESADLLINVSGTLEHPNYYRQVQRLIYIDSDPVFTQIKLAQGQDDFCQRVNTHDLHFSFGECLSDSGPTTTHHWRATRQPIVLSAWQPATPRRDLYTTIMNWTSYEPLKYDNRTYGQKDIEFMQFLDLPGRVRPARLEVALSKTQHRNWQAEEQNVTPAVRDFARSHPQWRPSDLLTHMGWQVVDPLQVCPDLESYHRYIQSSKAEWSIAKNGYVQGQSGWFSCRSACYLAAGRPVIVQETGFSSVLPVGEGILPFSTMDEAVAAIHEVEGNYARHAKAARAIAEAYFDANKVLIRLIEEAMNSQSGDQSEVLS
jgi:hypothetical protein